MGEASRSLCAPGPDRIRGPLLSSPAPAQTHPKVTWSCAGLAWGRGSRGPLGPSCCSMRTDPPCVGGPEATTMPGQGTGHCALVLVGNRARGRAAVGCARPPGPVVRPCPRAGGHALGGAHPCLFAGSLGLGRASGGDPVRVCVPRALLAPTPGSGPGTPVVFRRSVVGHRAGLGRRFSATSVRSPQRVRRMWVGGRPRGRAFCSLVVGRAGPGAQTWGLVAAGLWVGTGGFWKLGGFAECPS